MSSETNLHEEIAWTVIDKFFENNLNLLVKHHLDSYNDFFNNKIYNIFREKNPIQLFKEQDPDTKEYNLRPTYGSKSAFSSNEWIILFMVLSVLSGKPKWLRQL